MGRSKGTDAAILAKKALEEIVSRGGDVKQCVKEVLRLHKKQSSSEKRTARFVKTVISFIEKKGHLNRHFVSKLNSEFRKSGIASVPADKREGSEGGGEEDGGSDDGKEETGNPLVDHRSDWKKREQVNALIVRAQNGDNDARNEVVLMNFGLVVFVTKKYARESVLFEDLVGYGVEGLIRAIERFDRKNDKGAQFSTFAFTCVRHTIEKSIANFERTIRLPTYKVAEIEKTRKAAIGEDGLKEEKSHFPQFLSLDRRLMEDGDELVNFIPSKTPSPEKEIMNLQEVKRRKRMMALLKSRLSVTQWFVLERRFGLGNGEDGLSLEEIGQELSFTRERIRQIESIAIKRARKILKGFS